jgi:hypothetical protein
MEYAIYVAVAYVLYIFTMLIIDSTKRKEQDSLEPRMAKMESSRILKPESDIVEEKENDSSVKNALIDEDDEIISNEDIATNENDTNFVQKEIDKPDINEEIPEKDDENNPFDDELTDLLEENEINAQKNMENNDDNSHLKNDDKSVITKEEMKFINQEAQALNFDIKLKLEEAKSINVSSI